MDFTYGAYAEMLSLLKHEEYDVCRYDNYQRSRRCAILRHDVDFCLEAAIRFAELEYKNAVRSTYFILLSTSFYNLFDKKSNAMIKEIKAMGHDIGLHFDEARYPLLDQPQLIKYVEKEIAIMSEGLDMEIKTVSMHRPSKWVLEADLQFDKVINSYGKMFFNDFKYISDSRGHWREDVYQLIRSNAYERLHILTHPIWYGITGASMREQLQAFITAQKYRCYDAVRDNIGDLEEILTGADI